MNISVCITVLNDEAGISKLLEAIIGGTVKPREIIIVDAGSIDSTVPVIRHFQKKHSSIQLIIEKASTRGRARNLAVELTKYEIIAMTDSGCIPQENWLKKLTSPFQNPEIDVVSGYYRMVAKNDLQKAMSVYLGVMPKEFSIKFLPSTRSTAFTKKIWEECGGFPDELNYAEDTVFNHKLLKVNAKISRVKDAVVKWGMPESVSKFQLAIYNYAKGDAQSGIWLTTNGYMSHNVHSLFVLFRTVLAALVFAYFMLHDSFFLPFVLIALYTLWSYRKAGLWGIVLQPVSDIAVIRGFMSGIFRP